MSRTAANGVGTPFFHRTGWYVRRNKVLVKLAPGTLQERQAYRRGQRGLKPRPEVLQALVKIAAVASDVPRKVVKALPSGCPTVGEVVPLFLASKKVTMSEKGYENTKALLEKFSAAFGSQGMDEVTPGDVQKWVETHEGWKSPAYVRDRKKRILGIWNWAACDKARKGNHNPKPLITHNQMRGKIELEKAGTGKVYIQPEEDAIILENATAAFVKFYRAVRLSGLRPGHVASLRRMTNVVHRGKHILLKFKGKKFHKTNEWTEVVLNSEMQELVRSQLAIVQGDGLLFPTTYGHKWHAQSWNRPLKKLYGKINSEITMYSARHTHVTNCLAAGEPVSSIGDRLDNSPAVIWENYNQSAQLVFERKLELANLAAG
jgi:hypothetical protein